MEVGAKAGDFAKTSQNGREVVHISFDRRYKHSRIIRIESGSHHAPSPSDRVKKALPCRHIKDLLQWVNSYHKKEGRDWVPLP